VNHALEVLDRAELGDMYYEYPWGLEVIYVNLNNIQIPDIVGKVSFLVLVGKVSFLV